MQDAFRFLLARALPLAAVLLLSACATGPDVTRDAAFEADMQKAAAMLAERPAAAAAAFESIAERSDGEAASEAWLAAADAWLAARRPDAARAALDGAQPLPPEGLLMDRAVLIAAALDLGEQNPRQALLRLDREAEFDPRLFDRAVQLRGRALYQLGASLEATVLLSGHLAETGDARVRETDGRLIWQGLSRAREPLDLEQLPPETGPAVRGWIALGRIGQSAWQNPYGVDEQLAAWVETYRGHPAQTLLFEDIRAELERRFTYPDTIALLLPLSGRFKASAEAVRDGFLAGLYQHAEHREPPRVRVFDTDADGVTAVDAARRAQLDGADMIVGPLTKDALAAINNAKDIQVPLLGLNYLDPADAPLARDNLVQFGLLPEDEAIQAAERVIARGYTRGAALVPDNEFGLRMTAAFRARLEELGGELLAVQRYEPGHADYSTPIMRLLNLDESYLREQRVRSITGKSLVFEPRRRQDVEFVFMPANADEARLLKPQLRFHHAIALPVYSTSHVYIPGQIERDLDGIRFADMPWMLAPHAIGRETRDRIASLWPSQFERTARLYALGFDAFRLVPLVLGNDPALANPLPAMTGLLSLDDQQRIRRDLYWARFDNGVPELLPAVEQQQSAQGMVHAGSENPRTRP